MTDGFESLDDIVEYARANGFPELAESIEQTEACVEPDGDDDYVMRGFRDADLPLPESYELAYKFGVIVGGFLEREYPAED